MYLWSFIAQLSLSKLVKKTEVLIHRGNNTRQLLIVSDNQASSCHPAFALAQVEH